MKPFSGADLYDAMGKRNTDLDMGVSHGLVRGRHRPRSGRAARLHAASASTKVRTAGSSTAAKRLSGAARLRALGRLDLEMTRDLAPVAVMRTYNNRYFFSNRVVPRSFVYSGVYSDLSIPALALK